MAAGPTAITSAASAVTILTLASTIAVTTTAATAKKNSAIPTAAKRDQSHLSGTPAFGPAFLRRGSRTLCASFKSTSDDLEATRLGLVFLNIVRRIRIPA